MNFMRNNSEVPYRAGLRRSGLYRAVFGPTMLAPLNYYVLILRRAGPGRDDMTFDQQTKAIGQPGQVCKQKWRQAGASGSKRGCKEEPKRAVYLKRVSSVGGRAGAAPGY